jgi:hypothetical protein
MRYGTLYTKNKVNVGNMLHYNGKKSLKSMN